MKHLQSYSWSHNIQSCVLIEKISFLGKHKEFLSPPKKFFRLEHETGYDDCEGGFEDVSITKRSEVWRHFLLNVATKQGKCMHCSALLKTTGSTKCLHNHLKLKHAIILPRANQM